jgi:hypothetical protein
MVTSKGVIQGYCGVAAVDDAHQIILEAQAHGIGSEQELLLAVVQATAPLRTEQTLITADAGTCICPAGKHLYQNGANLLHNGYLATKSRCADCRIQRCNSSEISRALDSVHLLELKIIRMHTATWDLV